MDTRYSAGIPDMSFAISAFSGATNKYVHVTSCHTSQVKSHASSVYVNLIFHLQSHLFTRINTKSYAKKSVRCILIFYCAKILRIPARRPS